ncbi:hypothetical protein Hanom_Chr09g00847151 [Helianthus anomalus]
MNRWIKSQSTKNPLLVRQESLLLHIIRNRPVHRVMQLVSRHPWPSSPRRPGP